MERLCSEHDLFCLRDGLVRVPFLVKGRIIAPPETGRDVIDDAFRNAGRDHNYVKLPHAQVVREPVIDRRTMRYTGDFVYQVMPQVKPVELIETDIDGLVRGPYALPVDDVLRYVDSLLSCVFRNAPLMARVLESARITSELPDAFLDASFASLASGLNGDTARQMIDSELSLWGKSGTGFMNGWVEVPSQAMPGIMPGLAQSVFGNDTPQSAGPRYAVSAPVDKWKTLIRAMPTRQLHITAGNALQVPLASALRAILTKSAAVIKLPYGATLPGALLALAALSAAPDHPLTRHLSVVYWQGGDGGMEDSLFSPNAFDRIVVWGSPEAVTSVQSRAPFTRSVSFNPRYGVNLIGREAFDGDLNDVAIRASMDVMIHDQKACTSSIVQYVEGSEAQANAYAEKLQLALRKWDDTTPGFVSPATRGQIKRMRRGRYIGATWHLNERDGDFSSGVAVVRGEFDLLDHPLSRLVIVRPVDDLAGALKYLNQSVSTAGVFPEKRRIALMDAVAARGVSNVLPLGECERAYAGMPHDGMPVLSQLVDWKNGWGIPRMSQILPKHNSSIESIVVFYIGSIGSISPGPFLHRPVGILHELIV